MREEGGRGESREKRWRQAWGSVCGMPAVQAAAEEGKVAAAARPSPAQALPEAAGRMHGRCVHMME